MSRELQPRVPIKIELPTVIKNEPPESEIVEIGIDDILNSSESEEEIIPDVKGIDIVYHPVCKKSIKSEILESKHCESVETPVLVKAEDSPFIKTENTTQRIKTEDTSDENVTKGTGQMIEVQELQPPVPLVTLVKTEPPTVIKKEPLEEALEEDINTDIKDDIHIVYHSLSEDLIKSETLLEDGLENKHLESVQTQALVLAENSPFIKTKNITQRNKSEDTSDGNVSRGTGQGMVVVQVSNEDSNALSNLEIDEQSVLNLSKDVNSISVRSRKSKNPKNTDIVECYKTDDTALWKKEEIKVIKAPVIFVEAHEYTSLANNRHCCNHCQHTFKNLDYLKFHIKTYHRKVTTMYQCPYCSYKSKRKHNIINQHIIHKHKDAKDIQWFQCTLCEMKFKLKRNLTRHMKVHLGYEQMQDGLDLKRYGCNKCDYKTYQSTTLKRHKLIHLKPEEIQYLYCYHCSFKAKQKGNLKEHIFRHHFKNVKGAKRFGCNKCDYKTYAGTTLKRHKLIHLKPEEIQYFYCYHCSYKCKQKYNLINHIFRHNFKNVKGAKRFGCNKCDYETYTSTQLKNHKLSHLKPEEIQYFYCYHCSYKTKWKIDLKGHIFRHFKKEQVEFDCYICNFMTQKRESIIAHIKKHSKV